MSRIERTVEIAAPPARVFGFVAAEWETDLAFANGRGFGWTPGRSGRLRAGFRARFRGALVGVRDRMEIEILEYAEPAGWVARETRGLPFAWGWRFMAQGTACHATQFCEYRPRDWRGRLFEWGVGRRARASVVERSLARLKLLVEREVSLDRLRAVGPRRETP